MAFRWACARCGQLHGSNPSKCVNCRHTVLRPVSREKVERYGMEHPVQKERWAPSERAEAAARHTTTHNQPSPSEPPSRKRDTPTAIDPDEIATYTSAPDPDFDSSPDVALDGSIKTEESSASIESETKAGWSIPWWAIIGVTLLCFYGAFAYFIM